MARFTITFDLPSMAVQSAKSECDVHTILAQYRKTGILPNRHDAYYADVTAALDFQSAYNLVLDAERQFAALPARECELYGNDVQTWMRASAMRSLPAADQPEAAAAKAAEAVASTDDVAATAATTKSSEPPSEG